MKNSMQIFIFLAVTYGGMTVGFPQDPNTNNVTPGMNINNIDSDTITDPNVNHYSFGEGNETSSTETNSNKTGSSDLSSEAASNEANKTVSSVINSAEVASSEANKTVSSVNSAEIANIEANKTVSSAINSEEVATAEVSGVSSTDSAKNVTSEENSPLADTSENNKPAETILSSTQQGIGDTNNNTSGIHISGTVDITIPNIPTVKPKPDVPVSNPPSQTPSIFGGLGSNIFESASGFMDSARGVAKNTAGGIVEGTMNAASSAKDFADSAVNSARESAQSAYKTAKQMAEGAVANAASMTSNSAKSIMGIFSFGN